MLGAAYEYLIREFADSAGKKGGEFYTPRAVVRLMVRLADPRCLVGFVDTEIIPKPGGSRYARLAGGA